MALACAMFTSTSALAQTELADPVKPTAPVREAFTGAWTTPVAGKTYYIYNVAATQFMGAGRDWGTRTIATTDSIVSPNGAEVKVGADKNFAVPFALEEIPDESNIYIRTLNTSKGNGAYVTGEGNASWVDGGKGDRAGKWELVPVTGKSDEFMLHCANVMAFDPEADITSNDQIEAWRLLGIADTEAGSYTWNDSKNGLNWDGSPYKVTWKFVEASDDVAISIREWREATKAALEEANKVYEAEMALYNAKLALKATIAEAEKEGIEDVAEAIAIYNKAEATLAEVQKQNAHLQAEMAGLKYNNLDEFKNASESNPQDVTEHVLINPDFSAGNIDGWETNYVSGKQANNIGYQYSAGTSNIELPDGTTDLGYKNGDSYVSKFIEAWKSDADPWVIGDGYLRQTVYGLPNGKYVLEMDAISAYQWSNPAGSNPTKGVMIFIEDENGEGTSTEISTKEKQPQHFSVTFLNEGSDQLTFGLKTVNATANWIAADNFKLTYYGATTKTQAQLDLEAAIAAAEEYQEKVADKYYNAATKAAFDKAISDAQDTTDGTDEECETAKTNLEAAQAAVASSIEAYEVLLSYLDRTGGKNLLGQYFDIADNCGMNELTDKWQEWMDSWDEAYEEGTLTDAEIYEKTASIYPDLKAAWLNVNPADIKEGTDLTWLIENADFEEGDVYTVGSSKTIPGWTIADGDITRKDHVIEAYHRILDFNQVIPNMPAGVYDVTVQGFVRHDDGDQNDNKSTIFYAGDSQATLMQRSDQWHATGFYLDASQGDPCGGANKDQEITNSKGEAVKVPNGMSGFYYWEDEENPDGGSMDYTGWQTGDKYYTNHVMVIFKEAGDFTIGLKSLGTHDWIIWDNFGLVYLGQGAELYDKMVAEKFKSLEAAYDDTKIIITAEGEKKYDAIVKEIEDVKGTLTADTEAALEAKIDGVIDYLNEGHKLAIALRDDLSDYDEFRLISPDLICDDDNQFVSWVTTMLDKFPYDDYGMLDDLLELHDNEALQATTNDMNRRMADYVMQFAAANPYSTEDGSFYGNATEAIFNPRYVTYDPNITDQTTRGWTLEVADTLKGKAIGLGDNYAEMFNCSNFVISQTVRGLYPGWYLLTVDGFYRPGDYATIKTIEDTQKKNVVMFAESGELKSEKALKNIMEGAQTTPIAAKDEVKVTIDEKEYYIPNQKGSAATYLQQGMPVIIKEEGKEDREFYNEIAVPVDKFESPDPNLEYNPYYNSIYRNGMLVQVDESGEMTIGLRKKDNWVPNDWTMFGNWTLTYFGDEENIPTAVESVDAKNAKSIIKDIFTIDGRQTQRLQRGINIVRTADGKLHKVLVK